MLCALGKLIKIRNLLAIAVTAVQVEVGHPIGCVRGPPYSRC